MAPGSYFLYMQKQYVTLDLRKSSAIHLPYLEKRTAQLDFARTPLRKLRDTNHYSTHNSPETDGLGLPVVCKFETSVRFFR